MSNEKEIDFKWQVNGELNKVSPTFCLAKWLQGTVTLYNGETHSCHHNPRHKIEVADITKDPRKLHNTPIKIYQRQEMLDGIQTKGCDYCWRVENLPEKHLSDRTYKSSMPWAYPHFQQVLDSGLGEDIMPTYLEVAFESLCNFKCSYCGPLESSRWMEEVQQHGAYKLTQHQTVNDITNDYYRPRIPIHHKEHNPYIEAFWKWWPELYEKLHTFRITGGEPLLSDNTWRVIDYIEKHPHPNLELSINSNMGVPTKLVDKLISKVQVFMNERKLKRFTLYTSTEATGRQAEYVRFGMDWELFKHNVEKYVAETPRPAKLSFMTTHNVLSYSTWEDFMRWTVELRRKHDESGSYTKLWMMVNHLRHPTFMCSQELPQALKDEYLPRWRAFADQHKHQGLFLEEVDMVHRLCDFMLAKAPSFRQQADFALFFQEQDRRRGTNLVATFPELKTFYEEGLKLAAA